MAGATAPLLCPVSVTGSTINVSAFVADPNNAGAGIQNALNALASGGNNILSFTAGVTYIVNSFPTITGKNGWKIVGNGATIKAANGLAVSFGNHQLKITTCTDWVVDTLYFDGNRANRSVAEQEGHPVGVYDCDRGSFLSCRFDNSPGSDGIQLSGIGTQEADPTKFCTDILLFNCSSDNCYRGGLFVRNAYNVQVRGGSYTNANGTAPEFGIAIEPNVGSGGGSDACRDILIEGVTFSGNKGVHVYCSQTVPVRRVTMKGCRLNATGPDDSGNNAAGFSWGGGAFDGWVTGNTFENITTIMRAVINVQGGFVAGDASGLVVENNSFNTMNAAFSIIYVHSASGAGNIIRNNTGFALSDTFVVNDGTASVSNNTTVGARTDPSPTPPTSTSLSHCVVGGGARGIAYIETSTRATVTNNTTPQNVLRLSHVPASNTTWWYLGCGILDNSVENANSVFARLNQNTQAALFGQVKFPCRDITDRTTLMFMGRQAYGASVTTNNIDLDIWTTGAETVGFDKARILGLQQTSNDQWASDDAQTDNATTTFVDKLTLAGTFVGNYLLIFTAETKGDAAESIQIRATDGATTWGDATYTMIETGLSRFRTWSTAVRLTLAGAKTFKIQFRNAVNSGALACRNARIAALYLDSFRAQYYSEARSRTTTTSVSLQDKVTLTQVTGIGDHLAIGGAILDGNSNTLSTLADLERDAVAQSTHREEVRNSGEKAPFFTFRKENLTAASHTWKTRFDSETAALTTGIAESFIQVIDLNPFILTAGMDAVVNASGLLKASLDSKIAARTTKAGSLDAKILHQMTLAGSLHAVIVGAATLTKTATIDAILKKTYAPTASANAILQNALTKTGSLDARLQGAVPITCQMDADLAGPRRASLDAVIAAQSSTGQSKGARLDALLIKKLWDSPTANISIWVGASASRN